MSDDSVPPHDKENKPAVLSGDVLINQVQFASAFVTPFAAAVAAELEEFGLTKQKIDEIMVRSAKRFGTLNSDMWTTVSLNDSNQDDKSVAYLGWLKATGGQAYDFLTAVIAKHGPGLIDKLAPIVADALQQALTNYVKAATEPRGKKSKLTSRSKP